MLLMIDNFDSFTYNLVRYFEELGEDVVVYRNDVDFAQIQALTPDRLVISPGPGTPDGAGCVLDVIEHFAGKLPILGVCLGHQSIGQVFGGSVVRAEKVMHGKNSQVRHNASGLFEGLSDPLEVTRYHSLVIDKETLPDVLEVTAWTETETHKGEVHEIMAVRHKEHDIHAVQFHPEAALTKQGHTLLANFLRI